MKALSIHPYFAMAVVSGCKSIEVRTWSTEYRGDILICSTAAKYHGTIPSHALGIVTLKDVRQLKKSDCEEAMILSKDYSSDLFAWVLEYNRLIEPIPVKGKLSLWDFEEEDKIKIIPEEEWILQEGQDEKIEGEWVKKYWKPLMI